VRLQFRYLVCQDDTNGTHAMQCHALVARAFRTKLLKIDPLPGRHAGRCCHEQSTLSELHAVIPCGLGQLGRSLRTIRFRGFGHCVTAWTALQHNLTSVSTAFTVPQLPPLPHAALGLSQFSGALRWIELQQTSGVVSTIFVGHFESNAIDTVTSPCVLGAICYVYSSERMRRCCVAALSLHGRVVFDG
jgi:hypothetical protein